MTVLFDDRRSQGGSKRRRARARFNGCLLLLVQLRLEFCCRSARLVRVRVRVRARVRVWLGLELGVRVRGSRGGARARAR